MCPVGWLMFLVYLIVLLKTGAFGVITGSSSFGERYAINFFFIGAGFVMDMAITTKIWEWLENHSTYFGEYV